MTRHLLNRDALLRFQRDLDLTLVFLRNEALRNESEERDRRNENDE